MNRHSPSGGRSRLRLFVSLLLAAGATLFASSVRATLLWDGDANIGTSVFNSLQPVNGQIDIIEDPKGTLGKVFRLICHDNGNTKARCEVSGMSGITLSNTGNYYIGWRSMWGPLPTEAGKWQVLSQIHLAGAASAGAPVPFGLSVPGDGQMHVKYERPPDGSDTFSLWDHSFPLSSWHSFVFHIQFSESESTGWMEMWYDGVQQVMTNGKTRIPCAMAFPNCTSYFKWGVYRSGSGGPIGDSYAYLWRPRLGTTYADVDPLGGSGGAPVADPAFSPAAGTYSSAQTVSLTTSTSGAAIRYTLDGSSPSSTAGTLYSGPIGISASTTVKAIAYKTGSPDSNVVSAAYTITAPVQVADPVITPGSGTYSSAQSVTISTTTAGASIRYTTDGSTPSSTVGTVYSGAVSIASSKTLKAIAYKSGATDSHVVSATYTINTPVTLNFEAENLTHTASGATATLQADTNTSGGHWESLDGNSVGDYIDFTVPNVPAGTYSIRMTYKTNNNRGILNLKVDGSQLGGTLDQYVYPSTYPSHTFGTVTFAAAGNHTLRLTVTGKNSASSSYVLSADKFTLVGQ